MENSLVAARELVSLARSSPYQIVAEVDVRITKDGRWVAFHDASWTRLTQAKGRVRETHSRDLDRIRLPDGQSIPSISEMLVALDSLSVVLDIHDTDRAALSILCKQLAALGEERLQGLTVVSESGAVVRGIRKAFPRLATSATPVEVYRFLLAKWLGKSPHLGQRERLILPLVHRGFRIAKPDILSFAQAHGIPAWLYTVDPPEVARPLLEAGAVGLFTTQPRALLDQLSMGD